MIFILYKLKNKLLIKKIINLYYGKKFNYKYRTVLLQLIFKVKLYKIKMGKHYIRDIDY